MFPISLTAISMHAEFVDVSCLNCNRCSRLNVRKLIESYGASAPLERAYLDLSQGCHNRSQTGLTSQHKCSLHCPNLAALLRRSRLRAGLSARFDSTGINRCDDDRPGGNATSG